MTKEELEKELKPIDISKYKITETGQVLRMTKEELEKEAGQELIDERNYCGVDGYYGDYLDNVNTEILKRLNRLAELEAQTEKMKCCANCRHSENDNKTTSICDECFEMCCWELRR